MARKRRHKNEAVGEQFPARYLLALAVLVAMLVLISRRLIY
jgi:hypothetical protein